MTLEASAVKDQASGRISNLRISASEVDDGAGRPLGEAAVNRIGLIDVGIIGSEAVEASPSTLRVALRLQGSSIDLGKHGVIGGDIDLRATLVEGSDRVGVEVLRTTVGRTVMDFRGGIETSPRAEKDGDLPGYRYDLVSTRSVLAPEGSPEPALMTSVRIAGSYQEVAKRLAADRIIVKSGPGEMLGTASLQMIADGPPGISAAFSVHDMAVSHVKQMWPWFAGTKAHDWVMQNLFGGRISDATLQFQVVPGRLGNGVPLSANEVFGTFAVEGTRFDTAGLIPPVRDATGVVDFRANDVDIALSSGTVYLPSGKTVAASNGTLSVKRANIPPVIGALDIDVAGDAPAIAELASYDPINAMRFVGLAPAEFSGEVSGHVTADIPLQRGIDTSTLKWVVALDYSGLSIAKPVDGQMVTEAAGTIVVDPTKAVMSAKAKLSGVDAEIDAVEPVGKSGSTARKRTITPGARRQGARNAGAGAFRPDQGHGQGDARCDRGGPAADQGRPYRRATRHTLGRLEQGPRHRVRCQLRAREVRQHVDDVGLQAERRDLRRQRRYLAVGRQPVVGALLTRQAQPRRQCRRRHQADGSGLSVDISGESLDARSLVRQFTADTSTATKASETGSVSVHLDVNSLTGFHDERFSAVKLDYSGAGDKVNRLVVTANAQFGRECRNPQCRRKRVADDAHAVGRCRRNPAVPRHLRAHGGRQDRAVAERQRRRTDGRPGRRARLLSWSTSRA